MRRMVRTVVAVALGVGLMSGTIPGARAANTPVTIQNFSYHPTPVTVPVGSTVTWTNMDTAPHSATSDTPGFDTGILQQGQSMSITFNQAGTYTYHCTVHPYMHGTLIVQSAATAAPTSGATTTATAAATAAPAASATVAATSAATSVPLSASQVGLPSLHTGAAQGAAQIGWTAYAAGKPVSYLVTDASTRIQASAFRANFAPALSGATRLSRIYLVAGRAAPDQRAVLSSVPGDRTYSPLRREVLVRWASSAIVTRLTSERQITNLVRHGMVSTRQTSVILNAPAIPTG